MAAETCQIIGRSVPLTKNHVNQSKQNRHNTFETGRDKRAERNTQAPSNNTTNTLTQSPNLKNMRKSHTKTTRPGLNSTSFTKNQTKFCASASSLEDLAQRKPTTLEKCSSVLSIFSLLLIIGDISKQMPVTASQYHHMSAFLSPSTVLSRALFWVKSVT